MGGFELRVDIAAIVMLAVADQTQKITDDQLRTSARSRGFHRLPEHAETGKKIGPIHAMPGHSVATA